MQHATNSDARKLDLVTQRYRVVHGGEIVGQFSNIKLADHATREHRGAIVLDMSMKPANVVYQDGKWLEKAVTVASTKVRERQG